MCIIVLCLDVRADLVGDLVLMKKGKLAMFPNNYLNVLSLNGSLSAIRV